MIGHLLRRSRPAVYRNGRYEAALLRLACEHARLRMQVESIDAALNALAQAMAGVSGVQVQHGQLIEALMSEHELDRPAFVQRPFGQGRAN